MPEPGDTHSSNANTLAAEQRFAGPLNRKRALTHAALVWERMWPTLLTIMCIIGLYASCALLNIWEAVPGIAHWAAALASVAGIAWCVIRGIQTFEWPTKADALRRLETASGLIHRPLSALADTRADTRADIADSRFEGTVLWQHHIARLEAEAAKAQATPPTSAVPRLDTFALRGLVFLVLAASVVYAGRDAPSRLAQNVLPGAVFGSSANIAFDAWVTPPAYTDVPPLFLNTLAAADADEAATITIPTGSVLTARVYGASGADIQLAGEAHRFEADVSGAHEIDLPLTREGQLDIRANSRVLDTFALSLTPDLRPQILFTEGDALSVTPQLSLAVGYDVLDDYGVVSAEMRVTLPVTTDVDTTASENEPTDPTTELGALAAIEPPVLKLPLPGARVTDVEGEFAYKDLTGHPWAGLQVAITLAAFDEAGQEGISQTRIMRLPQRRFTDPIARAVVEQRQRLARTPDTAPQVATALNALTLHADRYYSHANDYLPLRAAYWRLRAASHPGDLDGIYDLLWDIALHFEDGDLSLAETALRDAQDALMDALANGASDAEIERLMNDLRQAMDAFLQALAQQQMQAGQNGEMAPMDPNLQELQRSDLESLLDALQDLAQSGSRDAARQLLSELRQMMENLANGTPGQMQMTPPQSAMNDAIGEMGEIIDQQRALQDETVQQGNGMPGEQGNPNGTPGSQQSGSSGLEQRQEALRGDLSQLRDGLEGAGIENPSALGRADRAMREAEDALESGDLERAARKQGEAIENLRDGAQALAETLLEDLAMSGENQGQDRGVGAEGRDPLGRPQRTTGPQTGEGVEVPDESDIQRARRILEELQRRAGDRDRPPIELDYLNRLLERF